MLKVYGDIEISMLISLTNAIIREGKIQVYSQKSVIVNRYKGKGDALDRGNYRGTWKAFERHSFNEVQFGFVSGKNTTEAIFIVRQLQKKYLGKHKELYFTFVDSEKAFDKVELWCNFIRMQRAMLEWMES